MPNRILKESICTSDTIEKLTPFQETFFYRLIVNCDDYGRMDARPAILKARLFPLKDRLTLREIEDALRALASTGCVELYDVDTRPYLYLPSWGVHQQIRAKKSKYPSPENVDKRESSDCIPTEIACNQLITDDCKCPRNPIQSESNPKVGVPELSGPPVIELILNDKSGYPVTQQQAAEWAGLYPAVDVIQELRKMKGWLDANPSRRKTQRGILRFIVSWLSKEQDKGRAGPAKPREEEWNRLE